jgi:hypothetical protein
MNPSYKSVYHEIEDVESAHCTVQQQVDSEEPGYSQPVNHTAEAQVECEDPPYLQPVDHDHVQVSYEHAAEHIRVEHEQSGHETLHAVSVHG